MILRQIAVLLVLSALSACGAVDRISGLTDAPLSAGIESSDVTTAATTVGTPGQGSQDLTAPNYRLGPGETIQIFVWRSPELSTSVPVRPDGRFSMPLIEDLQAAGKTPTELARDIEDALRAYVQDPIVTVIARIDGAGDPRQQVKVLGQAINPRSLPYRTGMTVLDVIISVGGLTEFADGNRAVLVRQEGPEKLSYRLRLDDLVRDGDINADRPLLPGDTIIVPESAY